jgi:hypothetical protein
VLSAITKNRTIFSVGGRVKAIKRDSGNIRKSVPNEESSR